MPTPLSCLLRRHATNYTNCTAHSPPPILPCLSILSPSHSPRHRHSPFVSTLPSTPQQQQQFVATYATESYEEVKRQQTTKAVRTKIALEARILAMKRREKTPEEFVVPPRPSPKLLSYHLNIQTIALIKTLIKLGYKITSSTDTLPPEVVDLLLNAYHFIPVRISEDEDNSEAHSLLAERLKARQGTAEKGERRAPIVTILGHVNHGKTSLLDALRSTSVAKEEAGRITQTISAFHVNVNNNKVTFVDTPGHAAFGRMRERGTKITDIMVLVVAADEGVKAQTAEVIQLIRKHPDTPLIVALNKCDKEGADPARAKAQLMQNGIMLEEFGGEVPCIEVSALKKQNLDTLINTIALVADMQNLRADVETLPYATVIESSRDRARGITVTVLVHEGVLKTQQTFVIETASTKSNKSSWGKIRSLQLTNSTKGMTSAGPSLPVILTGLKDGAIPAPGDTLLIVENETKAKSYYNERLQLAASARVLNYEVDEESDSDDEEEDEEEGEEGDKKEKKVIPVVKLILKAESSGSLQALEDILVFASAHVQSDIVTGGIGPVTASEVMYAKEVGASVFAFKVGIEKAALDAARSEKVDVSSHDIIYQLYDSVKSKIEALLPQMMSEKRVGRAEVKLVFPGSHRDKDRKLAGVVVTHGRMEKKDNVLVRVLRIDPETGEDRVVYPLPEDLAAITDSKSNANNNTSQKQQKVPVTGVKLASLRHFKDSVTELKKGVEGGLSLAHFHGWQTGDKIEAFTMVLQPGRLPPSPFSAPNTTEYVEDD